MHQVRLELASKNLKVQSNVTWNIIFVGFSIKLHLLTAQWDKNSNVLLSFEYIAIQKVINTHLPESVFI